MTTETKPTPFRVIDLKYPITVDGKLIDKATIRRMSAREVRDYIANVQAWINKERDGDPPQPEICDLADSVIDQLDDDDALAIQEAAEDFMPRRLRMLGEAADKEAQATSPAKPTPAPGADMSASSPPNSTPASPPVSTSTGES